VVAEMRREVELGRLCEDCVGALLYDRAARQAIAARFAD
jgi:hypothetical protein